MSYPDLSSVKDAATQRILRLVFDRIGSIQGRAGDTPTFSRAIDLTGNPITNVGDPTSDQDVVTKAYADATYGATAQRLSLMAGGTTPLPVIGLPGNDQVILVGTRGELPASPLPRQIYYATDLNALYVSTDNNSWTLVVGYTTGSIFGRPSSLTGVDGGYFFFAQDQAVLYLWSGNIWHYELGNLVDSFANRPIAGPSSGISGGFRFTATDRGYQQWQYSFTTDQWIFCGGGYPMQGTLPIPALGLTPQDAGFMYQSTDYDRQYEWNGGGWQDAAGQPIRGMVAFFPFTNPGTGWHICDGSGDTISTSAGSTAGFTRPNLVTGSNRFVRASTVAGGTGGLALQNTSVNIPSFNSGIPDSLVTVDRNLDGIIVSVGDGGHLHPVDPPSTTTLSWDNQPPYIDLVPYVRL